MGQREYQVYDSNGNPVAGQAVQGAVMETLDSSGHAQPLSTTNPLVISVASGGGGALDLLYTDDTGAQFVYRDSGATPPVFTAYLIPSGAAYTVGANPRPFAVKQVIIADGANVVEGALADAAVVTDANGTISGKLRGLVKMIASVINGTASAFQVSGTAAVGAVPSGYPLTVSAVSSDGNKRYFAAGTGGDTYGSTVIQGSDGVLVPIDSLAHTLTPAAPPTTGTQTDAVSFGGHTYTQTLTYSGGYLASWSNWAMS